MQPEQILHSRTRVLDLGPADQVLGELLSARGVTRYLGLTAPSQVMEARASGSIAQRIHPMTDSGIVEHCSADVLIIRSHLATAVWGLHGPIGAKFVAVERRHPLTVTEGRLAALLAGLTRQVRIAGRLRLGTSVFDVFEVCNPRGLQPRMYFSPVWGPSGFAARLDEANLNYTVLRWFEELPRIAPGEDLDVLVADEDLEAFRALVESEPGTQPLDLYSVSGLPYSDFRGAAYYPPGLARKVLKGAVVHESGFRVPAASEHLRSLAYHAIYHKGPSCGLPSEHGSMSVDAPDHDYASHLTRLAKASGVAYDATLEGTHRYLADVGWKPPDDALRRLTHENPWLTRLLDEPDLSLPGKAQLEVFLIRANTPDIVSYEEIKQLLDHFGFDTLVLEELDDEAQTRVESQLRGGNWGKGPFPRSGGIPVAFVVAVHHSPATPYPSLKPRYPHLTNAETYEFKEALRRQIATRVSPDELFNPIHSSDNTHEAWEYLRIMVPDRVPELRQQAEIRAGSFTQPENLIRPLSVGRRARVDVVESSTGPVVRKTFVPAFARFFERETQGMRTLARSVPEVPNLGSVGPNWFEIPYYHDVLPTDRPGPLPLPLLREMVDVLRRVHAAGYDVVDAKPENFLCDTEEGLKLIDLEFLYKYHDAPRPFTGSANFVGIWPGFDGDIPVGNLSYESRWLNAAGMPVGVLAEGSPTQQRLHRGLWAVRRLTVLPGAPPRRIMRRAREVARHQKWLAERRLKTWSQQRALRSTAVEHG